MITLTLKRTVLSFAATLAVNTVVIAAADGAELSQTNGVSSVTIDQLVAEALTNNPELRFYEAEIAAAKGGYKTARLWPNPEVTGSAGQKSVREAGLSTEGLAWAVSVAQPFEWPGRIGLRKAIANRDIELAQLGYERFKVALAGRVRFLGYTLFAAQEQATAAREVSERFRALREVLIQREPAGLTPLLEFRIIEAGELTMQRRASEAAVAQQSALFELNQLRGIAPSAPLVVQQTDLRFRPANPAEILLALARTNNFELRLRAIELAQQGIRVALAKNERFPTLSVGPSISEERAGDRERVIGVGLSIPLPLWNRNQGNIEVARAREIQAETSFYVTQREIERNVLEATVTYEASLRQMSQWRPDSVEHFKEAAEIADRHYRLGAVPIATYVELQDKYLEAVESLLQTKRQALESAQKLELLTGLAPALATPVVPEQKSEQDTSK